MNNVLIGIGSYVDELRPRVLAVAKAIGTVHVNHGETGCKTPDASAYIAKMVAHRPEKPRARKRRHGKRATKTKAAKTKPATSEGQGTAREGVQESQNSETRHEEEVPARVSRHSGAHRIVQLGRDRCMEKAFALARCAGHRAASRNLTTLASTSMTSGCRISRRAPTSWETSRSRTVAMRRGESWKSATGPR